MTVELTGANLTLDDVVRVARTGEPSRSRPRPKERMRERRRVVELAPERGDADVRPDDGGRDAPRRERGRGRCPAFNRSAILGHLVGLGPPAPDEVVRAALLCHANALAAGYQGARPEVAGAVRQRAERRRASRACSSLGTVGQSDLAQNADLARGALGDARARGRRGARAAERERVLDGAGGARGRRRSLVARVGWTRRRRSTSRRSARTSSRCSTRRSPSARPSPGLARDADAAPCARSRERALGRDAARFSRTR